MTGMNGSIGSCSGKMAECDATPRASGVAQAGGSGAGRDADRAGDARPAKAAVPVRILRQILLVIVLRVIELWRRDYFRGDCAVARTLQFGPERVAAPFCRAFLRV